MVKKLAMIGVQTDVLNENLNDAAAANYAFTGAIREHNRCCLARLNQLARARIFSARQAARIVVDLMFGGVPS